LIVGFISCGAKEMSYKRFELILSYRCNNNCSFCINSSRQNKIDFFRSTQDLKDELKNYYSNGFSHVCFNGGEPTLHPHIFDLIAYSKSLGYETIQVTTNGRLLSYPDFASRIVSVGVNRFLISVHGHIAQVHDSLTRVDGSFSQTIIGLKNLIDLREKNSFVVGTNTTICSQNYKYLDKIIDLLYQYDIFVQFTYFDASSLEDKYTSLNLMPRLKSVQKYLHDAIEKGISKSMALVVEGIPYCILGRYHYLAAENYFPEKWVINNDLISGISDVDMIPIKDNSKGKSNNCQSCSLNLKCKGMMKGYIDLFGASELYDRN
jgi:MoaA/NifB/PqqE/SkfB family radical SAM enzyme